MREWRSKKRIPPVLLLTGLPGVGKRSMAYFLSQWILCEKNGLNTLPDDGQGGLFGGISEPVSEIDPQADPRPCRQCGSCQKAEHGTWIDFTEIQSEDDSLKIDQFRKLKSSLGFGGHEGAYRIVLIPDADRMTIQAANSVLKLLEEPPVGWIFLLTAADSSLLLPTIVSRCQTIRLKPFSKEALTELLEAEGIDEKKRAICAELAQGSWGKALHWTESETWDRRKVVVDFLQNPKLHLNAMVDWSASDTQNMDRMIDQMESLVSDLIRWSLTGSDPERYAWLNSDARATLVQHCGLASKRGVERSRQLWLERAERMARARQEMQAPINRKLLAQDLLLPWLT